MNMNDLIAEMVAEATGQDGDWSAEHVAKLLAEKYLEDPEKTDALVFKAARHDLDKWEHSRTPKLHEVEGQGRLFYDPEAILILGDNERRFMADARPAHARRRVMIVHRNLRAQMEAANTELAYWDDRMEDWPENQTLDQIERVRFGFVTVA